MATSRRTDGSALASRRASRRARQLAQRRADMLSGAAGIFARKGYEGTQMAEIAAAAEVSLASLYTEFRGKEQIYEAVIEDGAVRTFGALRDRVEAIDNPGEALLVLIDTLFECLEQDVALVRLVLSGSAGIPWRIRANRHSRATDEIATWVIATCQKAVRRGALRGLDGLALAHTLMGGVLRAAAHAIDHKPERPLTELAPRLRAIFARLLEGEAR